MLFFDFLIAFVARIWYYFMRKGLRRKPTLVKLTILSLLVEISFWCMLSIFLFQKSEMWASVLATIIIVFLLFLLICVYVSYSLQISIGCMNSYAQNKKAFMMGFLILCLLIFSIYFWGLNIFTIYAGVVTAIGCIISVGNMLPDGRLRRKKIRRQL